MRAMAKQLNRSTVWFDGEVTADNFSHVMTQLRRHKEIDPSIFEMHLFDIDIANAAPFIERYRMLEQVLYYPPNNVVLVNHGILKHNDHHHCEGVMKFYIHEGYEGTVLKVFDSPYTGKKSDFWCKMKPWHTVDMLVQEVIPGKGKHEGRMGALLCEGEGYTAKVGTGFTDAERESFLVTPPTMIEVKYQEVTKDKSLRFPSFVRVREDK
jgi:DNA ligase-1